MVRIGVKPISIDDNLSTGVYITGTGQKLLTHDLGNCKGDNCVIHNPSKHSMSNFPTHWRQDRQLMERICCHGIGHPDPDDLTYKKLVAKTKADFMNLKYEGVHGCDGCCV